MADEQGPEDQMIEIGDPTEEPTGIEPVAPPRVVIEYRDRGVPWMLIPPLLVLAAVVAVVAAAALRPEPERVAARVPVPAPTVPTQAAPIPTPTPVVPTPALAPASTPEPAPPPVAVVAVAPPVEPSVAPVAEPDPDPPQSPRVQDLGFDPDAFKPDPKVEAPVDPALALAGQGPARDGPAAGPGAVDADKQPVEVDPEVLPPDPKRAIQLRLRRIVEAKRQADVDRVQFHAELAAICRRQGDRAAPAIQELCLKYGNEVEPAIKQQAAKMLGQKGIAAGVSRPVRINLLRKQGFPEPAVLLDIFEQDMRLLTTDGKTLSKAVRGGPRSMDEVFCLAAQMLLNNPPWRAATPASTRPAPVDARSRSNPGDPSASNAFSAPATPR